MLPTKKDPEIPVSARYESPKPARPLMFGPNIIGTAGGLQYPDDIFSGSLYRVGTCDKGYERDYGGTVFGLDASLSSSVYGASQTIQPSSMRFLACIKS